jgi:hypothetical protein
VIPIQNFSLVSCGFQTEAQLTGLYQTALIRVESTQADPAVRCIFAVLVLWKPCGAVGDGDIGTDFKNVMAVMYSALGAARSSALSTSAFVNISS